MVVQHKRRPTSIGRIGKLPTSGCRSFTTRSDLPFHGPNQGGVVRLRNGTSTLRSSTKFSSMFQKCLTHLTYRKMNCLSLSAWIFVKSLLHYSFSSVCIIWLRKYHKFCIGTHFLSQVPFLSLGAEGGDVGLRQERCRGKSQMSGEFVVEDVSVNGEIYRRLVFFNNPKLIQSESRIILSGL